MNLFRQVFTGILMDVKFNDPISPSGILNELEQFSGIFTSATGKSFNNNGALAVNFLDILLEDGRPGRLIRLFILHLKMDDGGSFVKGPRDFLWDDHLILLSSNFSD
jgi:hypothetical protein